jgi:hypothetical protein
MMSVATIVTIALNRDYNVVMLWCCGELIEFHVIIVLVLFKINFVALVLILALTKPWS